MTETVEQRPGSDKTKGAAKQIARPELRPWVCEIVIGLTLRQEEVNQDRHIEVSKHVEDKAPVRFQSDCAAAHAKNRGGDGPDVRYDLDLVMIRICHVWR